MKKSTEQTFQEIVARNEKSSLHQAAFTVWRDSNYQKKDQYDQFKKFCRWWDPSWTVPDHVQPILDLYQKKFQSHKIIVTDRGQGVKMHMNPSNTSDIMNWREWNTWSYTMCVPWDLNEDFDPVVIIIGPDINLYPEYSKHVIMDISKFRAIICQPFTRLSFASSRFSHGVCSSNNRLLWILSDMQYVKEPPHIEPDIKVIDTVEKLEHDLDHVINLKNLQHQFMSDLSYFNSFGKEPNELDWVPLNL